MIPHPRGRDAASNPPFNLTFSGGLYSSLRAELSAILPSIPRIYPTRRPKCFERRTESDR